MQQAVPPPEIFACMQYCKSKTWFYLTAILHATVSNSWHMVQIPCCIFFWVKCCMCQPQYSSSLLNALSLMSLYWKFEVLYFKPKNNLGRKSWNLVCSLGCRRLIGNTNHYHVRSTLGSFETAKQENKSSLGCLMKISPENPECRTCSKTITSTCIEPSMGGGNFCYYAAILYILCNFQHFGKLPPPGWSQTYLWVHDVQFCHASNRSGENRPQYV